MNNKIEFMENGDFRVVHQYKSFDDWFDEIENYSTRGDRFYEDLKHGDPSRILVWLKTAFQMGKDSRDVQQ